MGTKNSNELLMKNLRLRLLSPTLFRPVDTTTTCSENNTKRNKKLKLNSSDSFPKLMPKSPLGEPNTKPKISRSILNDPTPPLLLLTKNSETSTKSLPNTNRKKKNSRLNLNPLRKRVDPCPLNSSKLRMLTKKLLTALKPLN